MRRERIIAAVVLFGMLAVILYMVNTNILAAENRLTNGQPVYLDLAPRDPRSLIQGDYMVLRYAIEQDAANADGERARSGVLVGRIDENSVLHFERFDDGTALGAGEVYVHYRTRERWSRDEVRVGVDSFFFQEGLGDEYVVARYAEMRLTEGGTLMLVDLVGEDFERLVP
ncbi:MAG: GDYXXLXY domain-containing protein [Chloroflexota bacterium]